MIRPLIAAALLAAFALPAAAQAPAPEPAATAEKAAPAAKKKPVKKATEKKAAEKKPEPKVYRTTQAPILDKEGKVIPTSPDAYDVSSAIPPKKR